MVNWGSVKFRHELKGTADAQYLEHLRYRLVPEHATLEQTRQAVTQCHSRDEWHVLDTSIDLGFQANSSPFTDSGTPQCKMLTLEAIDDMGRLQYRLSWYTLDNGLFDAS